MQKKALKSSEKAWVYKRQDYRPNNRKLLKHSYLEFVRYMRWYCTDSRSYLYLKLHPRVPIGNGKWSDAVYANWPKHIE